MLHLANSIPLVIALDSFNPSSDFVPMEEYKIDGVGRMISVSRLNIGVEHGDINCVQFHGICPEREGDGNTETRGIPGEQISLPGSIALN